MPIDPVKSVHIEEVLVGPEVTTIGWASIAWLLQHLERQV